MSLSPTAPATPPSPRPIRTQIGLMTAQRSSPRARISMSTPSSSRPSSISTRTVDARASQRVFVESRRLLRFTPRRDHQRSAAASGSRRIQPRPAASTDDATMRSRSIMLIPAALSPTMCAGALCSICSGVELKDAHQAPSVAPLDASHALDVARRLVRLEPTTAARDAVFLSRRDHLRRLAGRGRDVRPWR